MKRRPLALNSAAKAASDCSRRQCRASCSLSPAGAAGSPRPCLRQDAVGFVVDRNGSKDIEIDPNADKHRLAAETLLQLVADPGAFRDRPQTQAIRCTGRLSLFGGCGIALFDV